MSDQIERIARARLVIREAAKSDDPDSAIAQIMEAANITTGDVAGQFFSDFDDLQNHWSSISIDERTQLLSDYLDTEAIYRT